MLWEINIFILLQLCQENQTLLLRPMWLFAAQLELTGVTREHFGSLGSTESVLTSIGRRSTAIYGLKNKQISWTK